MAFTAAGFFDQSIDSFFVLDEGGTIVAANPAFGKLLGREAHALPGMPLKSFVADADHRFLITALEEAKAGRPSIFHLTVRAADGAARAIEVNGSPSSPEGVLYCVGRRALAVIGSEHAGNEDGAARVSLQDIVREISKTLGTKYTFISFIREWPATRIQMVAAWAGDAPAQPFEYSLGGTPCEAVLSGKACAYPDGVQEAFPDDLDLPKMNVESYLGIPVMDEGGIILGHVCTLDEKPLARSAVPQYLELLRAAGRTASRELGRMRAEALLALGPEANVSLEGTSLYHAITRQIAQALQVDIVFASEFEDPPTHARMLSMWDGETHSEGLRYPLENTPCALVARGEACQIPSRAAGAFPGNTFLEGRKIESCVAVPLVDSHGKPIGVLVMLDRRPMDAIEERAFSLRLFAGRVAAEMERLRAKQGAEESDARFRLLVEHAADMLLGHDVDGTIRECNRAAQEALGLTREELIGKNLADIREGVSAEDVAREGMQLEPAIPTTMDATFRRKDGTTFPAEVRTVLFEYGESKLALASARDVTEQRQAAHLLESALASLQTPIIEVWDGIVALPVIGAVDGERASKMTLALLDTISEKQADVAILDLTGVSTVDAETANHLLDIARAASLLGSDCLVSGITPAVARTLVDLGAAQTAFRTFATLQSALRDALGRRGVRVSKR